MQKFIICLTGVLLISSAAGAVYVRKTVRPQFFIPESELNRVEKLPPFPVRPQPAAVASDEDINYVIPAEPSTTAEPVVAADIPPENVHVNFLQVKPMEQEEPALDEIYEVDTSTILPEAADAEIDKNLEQNEDYRQIMRSYADDLKALAETGKMPENAAVNAALKKMNSNDSIWVDDTFKTTTE